MHAYDLLEAFILLHYIIFFRLLPRKHSWLFLLSFSFYFGHNFKASPFGVYVWIPHFIMWSKEQENEGELWTVCTYERSKHKWRSWYNVLKFETILGYLLQFHGFHWQKILQFYSVMIFRECNWVGTKSENWNSWWQMPWRRVLTVSSQSEASKATTAVQLQWPQSIWILTVFLYYEPLRSTILFLNFPLSLEKISHVKFAYSWISVWHPCC